MSDSWTIDASTTYHLGIDRWTEDAECRGAPMEWFVGDPSPPEEAYEICARCAVRSECGEFGEREWRMWGTAAIYGGRLFYRKPGRGRTPIYPCGTYQGRRRHQRRGEEVCGPCREAKRISRRRRSEWVVRSGCGRVRGGSGAGLGARGG